MPAVNMGGPTTVPGNPSAGKFVMMDPLSGPKGSPKDKDQSGNYSTGALSTGIGFGATQIIPPTVAAIDAAGFDDDYTPGVTRPNGVAATTAILLYIGGGRSNANSGGVAATNPYAVQPILGFGGGGSRDAGAGPTFTGFGVKMVTAAGAVANGAAIETGFVNRTGVAMTTGQSAFGSSTTASAAVT